MFNKKEIVQLAIDLCERPITSETQKRIEEYNDLPRFKINDDLPKKDHKQAS